MRTRARTVTRGRNSEWRRLNDFFAPEQRRNGEGSGDLGMTHVQAARRGGQGPDRGVPSGGGSGGGPRLAKACGRRLAPQVVGAGGATTWSAQDRGEKGLIDGSHGTIAVLGQTSLNPIQNLNGSNRFKFFQNLVDPKGTFSRSNNLK
jgi:hypothetical protein